MNRLTVHQPGVLTTVQDLGRPGLRRFGVPLGGAMDRDALRIANALVGNPDEAAALECTLSGPQISFAADTWIAIAGGTLPGWPYARPVRVEAGQLLSFRRVERGCRAYIAVAGGLIVPQVLGSCSTYLPGRFGGVEGRSLLAGDEILVGASDIAFANTEHWAIVPELLPHPVTRTQIRIIRGAQWDRFSSEGVRRFFSDSYRVLAQSDRMGLRLSGPAVEAGAAVDMLSEPVAAGAIQIPPDGQPIVLMADCQTLGGYPKLGHVITVDLPRVAQLQPGESVRFRECSVDVAEQLLLAHEVALGKLRTGLSQKLR